MTTNARPSNTPETGGTDFRVPVYDRAYEEFATSCYTYGKSPASVKREPLVEVQAFRPSRGSGGYATTSVVTIAIHAEFVMADVMLSPSEAREVAIALIQAAAEGDALTANAR